MMKRFFSVQNVILKVTISFVLLFSSTYEIFPLLAEENVEEETIVETEQTPTEEVEEPIQEEGEQLSDSFHEEKVIDYVVIKVSAEAGVFPNGSTLSVTKVEDQKVDEAVEAVRNENVVRTYTYDIKVFDSEGNEVQPKEGQKVHVSFQLEEVVNDNLNTQVYHIDEELKVEALEVTTEEDVASVETEGFSYYTVEFTYEDKQYVLEGGSTEVPLMDILNEVGLSGTIENAEVSNQELISVGKYNGSEEWVLSSLQPFQTTEWLKVTLDGIEYQITLTDSYEPGPGSSTDKLFAKNAPIATMTIDSKVLGGTPGVDIILENVQITDRCSAIEWDGNTIVARDVLFQNGTTGASYSRLGGFTLRYKNAVTLSDGKTKKDLLLEFNNIHIAPRIDTDNQETHDIRLVSPNGKVDGNNNDFIFISTKILTTSNTSRAGLRAPINIKVEGVSSDETYVFSAFGFNLGNFNSSGISNNRNRILYWNSNRDWVEQLGLISGINKESNVYVPNNLVSSTTIETFSSFPDTHVIYATQTSQSTQNSDKNYLSGEVTVANGKELKTLVKSYYPYGDSGPNTYLFPDGITHNYTSSSGYFGKIELNTEGYWNSDGSLPINTVSKKPATLLYGGRLTTKGKTGAIVVDRKRTYDVPYGKEVTYKMTPEDSYIIDQLYIDGAKIDKSDKNFKTVYKNNDGYTVDYYTYTFKGDDLPGDLNKPDFDPRSEKGGSAHTIHVTWQPTVEIDYVKNWDDFNNLYQLRPNQLEITLKQDGSDYRSVLNSSTELFYNPQDPSIPTAFPYPLTGSSTDALWPYTWPSDASQRKFMRLPMYRNYNEITNKGDLYNYVIEEKIPDAVKDYYVERQPHEIIKFDYDITQSYLATNERPDGYTESGLIDGSHREVDYSITNELKSTELFIEKAVKGGNSTFQFNVNLKNSDLTVSEFDGFKQKGTTGYEKTISGPGNSLVKNKKEIVASTRLLPNTEYTVTETLPADWKETDQSKASKHNGTIFDTSNVFAYQDVNTGDLYIPDGSGGYKDRNGDSIQLPVVVFESRLFDNSGMEVVVSQTSSTGLQYRYGDRKDVPLEAISNMVIIDYASIATLEDNQLVYKASKQGDNGVTKEENILLAKPIYGVWFENEYIPKPTPRPVDPKIVVPDTGDAFYMSTWMTLFGGAIVVVLALLFNMMMQKRNQ